MVCRCWPNKGLPLQKNVDLFYTISMWSETGNMYMSVRSFLCGNVTFPTSPSV